MRWPSPDGLALFYLKGNNMGEIKNLTTVTKEDVLNSLMENPYEEINPQEVIEGLIKKNIPFKMTIDKHGIKELVQL